MGPFPHERAAGAEITPENPGRDGWLSNLSSSPTPTQHELRDGVHADGVRAWWPSTRPRAIELWQQGDITYVLNAEPGSFAAKVRRSNTAPVRPAMGWRVRGCGACVSTTRSPKGAEPYSGDGQSAGLCPRMKGIGGSLIYFAEQYSRDLALQRENIDWLGHVETPRASGSTTWIT